jgi:nucleoside-diphosphate-sugar epimerase
MSDALAFDKVLVTGAAGLLGRYIVRELRDRCAVTGFDVKPPADGGPCTTGDIADLAAVNAAVAGMDAVVHVAARANIWAGTPEEIVRTNLMGTWNVLHAAAEAGARRVVLCSSDSVVGYTVMSGAMLPPAYLPIDTDHPLRPTDPYALSKKMGEAAGQSFADRGALEVVVLRPVFVLYPEMHGEVIARAADPAGYRGPAAGGPSAAGGGTAWHYVDPRDAARGFRLALELADVRYATFFLCGPNTLAPEPTLERLQHHLGLLPELRHPEVYRRNPFAPLYDLDHARDGLGFEAEHDLRPVLYGDDA